MDLTNLVVAALVGSLFVIAWFFHVVAIKSRHKGEIVQARKSATGHSRLTVKGNIAEQWALHFPDVPYEPADARFLGKPIDFVVFDGYTEATDGTADRIEQVVFLEIKTGAKAGLSPGERLIKECIDDRRVVWHTLKLSQLDEG